MAGVVVVNEVNVVGPATDTELRATPLPVSDGGASLTIDGTVAISGTVPVSAAALPLPAGAATEATLASINTKTLAAGQAAMASSYPVVIASNQTVLQVGDNAASLTTDTPQLPAALVDGRLDANNGAWLGSTAPTVGQKVMVASLPVTLASDQPPISVTIGSDQAIPISVGYDSTLAVAGAQAAYWYCGATFVVPAGYSFSIGQYNAAAYDNRVTARISKIEGLAAWNPTSFELSSTASYTAPEFGSFLELAVVAAMGNVNDQVITISYTNSNGVAGRTATAVDDLKLKKNTPVGFKLLMALQAGDIGVTSVQSVTANATNTGSVSVQGGIELYLQRCLTAESNYIVVPSAANPVIPAGDTIAMCFASNAGATTRRVIKCIGTLGAV